MTFIGMLIEGHACWCGTLWASLDDQGENSKGHLEVISRLIVNQACQVFIFVGYYFFIIICCWSPNQHEESSKGFFFFCVQRFIPMKWLWSLIFNVLKFLCMFSCATLWVIDNCVDLVVNDMLIIRGRCLWRTKDITILVQHWDYLREPCLQLCKCEVHALFNKQVKV